MNSKYLLNYYESPFSKVILNKTPTKRIIQKICKSKTKIKISKKIKIEPRTWQKIVENKEIKCFTLKKLKKICKLKENYIRKNIKQIDGIKNPNIPLNFNCKEGVRLDVGVINEGRTRERSIEYTNKDKEIIKIIKKSSKKVISKNFIPKKRTDKRDKTVCLSFPAIVAKHFIKIGLNGSKKHTQIRIPNYILKNKEYNKIWWRGNISEEASIYPYVWFNKNKRDFYIYPKIQLNRVKSINIKLQNIEKEKTYYQKDIPLKILINLQNNIMQLIKDESKILSNFGIYTKPQFSKIYVNKKYEITATYSIYIYRLEDLNKYYNKIGFELERHKKQFKLLLNARGSKTKEEIREILVKFYKLVPNYLRGVKRIKTNKFLTKIDKENLLGDKNAKTSNCNNYGACRPW